jgi:L-rhamnono-1,4-lactonase
MTSPSHPLAKQHIVSDYLAITRPQPAGFVYVETDRYLPSFAPDDASEEKLHAWAKEPLAEVKFLRDIVERHGGEMKGCVVFAPFHLAPDLFRTYLVMLERVAGPALWDRIVGFRYLLQGKGEGGVEKLVSGEDWLSNVASLSKGRGGRGWCFDVGADVNRDGEAGLEAVGEMVREVRRREGSGGGHVRFILSSFPSPLLILHVTKLCSDHLCKPNFSSPTPSTRWKAALEKLAGDENVYMKLSGAFNEFDTTPSTVSEIVSAVCSLKVASQPFAVPLLTCLR